jgi:hypothetical protein
VVVLVPGWERLGVWVEYGLGQEEDAIVAMEAQGETAKRVFNRWRDGRRWWTPSKIIHGIRWISTHTRQGGWRTVSSSVGRCPFSGRFLTCCALGDGFRPSRPSSRNHCLIIRYR